MKLRLALAALLLLAACVLPWPSAKPKPAPLTPPGEDIDENLDIDGAQPEGCFEYVRRRLREELE